MSDDFESEETPADHKHAPAPRTQFEHHIHERVVSLEDSRRTDAAVDAAPDAPYRERNDHMTTTTTDETNRAELKHDDGRGTEQPTASSADRTGPFRLGESRLGESQLGPDRDPTKVSICDESVADSEGFYPPCAE